ncbi:MAG: septal ring lytic transglycosylase RlpA family protein [Bacteroidota bacterium]
MLRTLTLLSFCLVAFALSAQTTSGIASYYHPGFDGKPTSTGEKYDHDALTCANKEFPRGSLLRVTRVDDGRSVVVRVNDCGPHKQGRIVDLSGAAAERIGLIRDGLTQVNVEVVRLGTGRRACGDSYTPPTASRSGEPTSYDNVPNQIPEEEEAAAPVHVPLETQGTFRADALRPIESGYGVQVGSYRVYENASKVAADLQAKGYSKVLIRLQGNVHQVVLGPFESREAAATYKNNLWRNYKMEGFVTPITTE